MVVHAPDTDSPVCLRAHGDLAWVEADAPPVNALSLPVRLGLLRGVQAASDDPAIRSIALSARGQTFYAGADIEELEHGVRAPGLIELIHACDHSLKPVLCALFGSVYGGGVVVAYAGDWRLAARGTRFALPEVGLGLLPTFGGTQWLPRWLGVEAALRLTLDGEVWSEQQALEAGLVDEVVERVRLVDATERRARSGVPKRRIGDPSVWRLEDERLVAQAFARRRDQLSASAPDFQAAWQTLDLMETGLRMPIEQALEREHAVFERLRCSAQSRRLRALFFADRRLRRAQFDREGLKPEIERIGSQDTPALCALARRAVDEGRIPDEGLFDALAVEVLKWPRHRPSLIASQMEQTR